VLEFQHWGAMAAFTFVLAFAAIMAGLVGLVLQYRRERQRAASEDDDDEAPPRIHRQTPCGVEPQLLDRLVRAVRTLHQYAWEKNWSPDWPSYDEHIKAAESLMQTNDLPAAFREYCRALLPLTRALNKQRNKEESFKPLWDKTD
jgi:hypothetical protein